jgi:hypothetical protein
MGRHRPKRPTPLPTDRQLLPTLPHTPSCTALQNPAVRPPETQPKVQPETHTAVLAQRKQDRQHKTSRGVAGAPACMTMTTAVSRNEKHTTSKSIKSSETLQRPDIIGVQPGNCSSRHQHRHRHTHQDTMQRVRHARSSTTTTQKGLSKQPYSELRPG